MEYYLAKVKTAKTPQEALQVIQAGCEHYQDDAHKEWEFVNEMLSFFATLITQDLPKEVSEFCKAVFKTFEPGISNYKRNNLRNEADWRYAKLILKVPDKITNLILSDQATVKSYQIDVIGKLLSDGQGNIQQRICDDIVATKTEDGIAIICFGLYVFAYQQYHGTIPGGGWGTLATVAGVGLAALNAGSKLK